MRRYKAAASSTRRSQALLALLLGTTLGLAGCGSIDDALFGGDTSSDQGAAPADTAQASAPSAGMLPGTAPSEGAIAASDGPRCIRPHARHDRTRLGHRHGRQPHRAKLACASRRHPGQDSRRSAAARRFESDRIPIVAAISRGQGEHHGAPAARHDARQPRARGAMEQFAVRARYDDGQHQCDQRAGHAGLRPGVGRAFRAEHHRSHVQRRRRRR